MAVAEPNRVVRRTLESTVTEMIAPASVLDADSSEWGLALQADLVVSREVLMQEADRVRYVGLVQCLLDSAKKALLVTGYEMVPGSGSSSIHLHEPLSETLRRLAPEVELYPLREEQEVTTFLVLKPPLHRHPRDYGPDTLRKVIDKHPNPIRLAAVRMSAWKTVGFFPDHEPRLFEYPTAAEIVSDLLPKGSRIADVGAGVNPLVPYLHAHGYLLDSVDPSRLHRPWPPPRNSNEWGFIDYAKGGWAHRSWNCTLDRLPISPPFDGIICVSVIEHLKARKRRSLLRDMARRVRPGGIVVLTVDLVRGNDELWNRVEGKTVERARVHGTFDDVIAEAGAAGLKLLESNRIRNWGDVRVDIGLFVLQQEPVS